MYLYMGKSKEVKITVRILYLFFIFLQKPIIFINFATECHLSGFTGSYMYVLYKLLLHHIFLRVWFFEDCSKYTYTEDRFKYFYIRGMQ